MPLAIKEISTPWFSISNTFPTFGVHEHRVTLSSLSVYLVWKWFAGENCFKWQLSNLPGSILHGQWLDMRVGGLDLIFLHCWNSLWIYDGFHSVYPLQNPRMLRAQLQPDSVTSGGVSVGKSPGSCALFSLLLSLVAPSLDINLSPQEKSGKNTSGCQNRALPTFQETLAEHSGEVRWCKTYS